MIFCIIAKQLHKIQNMAGTRFTNLDYLKEITGGEPEIVKEFIQLFFDQLPEFKGGMTTYLAEEKWKELGDLAHKAKSSVMTFGMNELGHRLKELQLKTQNLEDIDSYSEYVEEFMNQIGQAEIELHEELKMI